MSSSSDARRRAEIESKRAKLAQLKKAREERTQRLQASTRTPSETGTPTTSRKDLDDLVSTLVASRTGRSSAVGSDTPASPRKSGGITSSEYGDSEQAALTPTAREFIEHQTELFELPQRERVYYTKEVQTAAFFDEQDTTPPTGGVGTETRDEETIRAKLLKEQAEQAAEQAQLEQEITEQLRELSEQERLAIYGATDFTEFVEQSTKIVERALADSYDYMKDYRITGEVVEDRAGQGRLARTFWAEGFRNRSITALDWSTKYPELVVASYNRNELASDESDGLVAIWNMHLKDRPEFIFHAQTDVLSVAFSPFHPNLVIGGTYSGQILVWDTRGKALPILKTPLSAAGHTHPVYSIRMVGTQNAHNLITASTDGLVCSWMLDMLARPQESLELLNSLHAKTDEVCVTALSFPDQETTSFWVGTEEGTVFSASRYDRAGSKAGLNSSEWYKGHAAPVTGLEFHPLQGAVDFSDLFLTSSMDWTTKLWRTKTQCPILSLEEASEYVYDVKWHPHHPAVFAQVDGCGKLNLYNLNVDTERPVQSIQVTQGKALNKLSWDRRDARYLAVGGSDGHLYIYDLFDTFTLLDTDTSRFQQTIASLL